MKNDRLVRIEMRMDFLKKIQAVCTEYQDMGPEGEGWQSDDWSAVCASLSEAMRIHQEGDES